MGGTRGSLKCQAELAAVVGGGGEGRPQQQQKKNKLPTIHTGHERDDRSSSDMARESWQKRVIVRCVIPGDMEAGRTQEQWRKNIAMATD